MKHLIEKQSHKKRAFNNSKLLLLSLLLLLFKANESKALVLDSLRLVNQDGKNFILHKADKGQTLFGLLRKYGSNIGEFKAENPGVPVDIKIGQILRIPYNKALPAAAKAKVKVKTEIVKEKPIVEKTNNVNSEAISTQKVPAKTIKVGKGMTLFSIANKYGLTLAQIKKMNNLKTDGVQIGQTLIVKEGVNEIQQKEKPEPIVVKDAKPKIDNVIVKTAPSESIIIDEKPQKPAEKPVLVEEKKVIEPAKKPIEVLKTETKVAPIENKPKIETVVESEKAVEPNESLERVLKIEEGIAELIEVESKSGKYLALHKTAPLGTLVQVKNETNGASVWVKVIGRLPALDQNENVIIKLSPRAMARVSPVDKKFRAKINYSL